LQLTTAPATEQCTHADLYHTTSCTLQSITPPPEHLQDPQSRCSSSTLPDSSAQRTRRCTTALVVHDFWQTATSLATTCPVRATSETETQIKAAQERTQGGGATKLPMTQRPFRCQSQAAHTGTCRRLLCQSPWGLQTRSPAAVPSPAHMFDFSHPLTSPIFSPTDLCIWLQISNTLARCAQISTPPPMIRRKAD